MLACYQVIVDKIKPQWLLSQLIHTIKIIDEFLYPQISPLLSPRVLGSPAVTATVTATPPKLRQLSSKALQKTPLSLLKGKSEFGYQIILY